MLGGALRVDHIAQGVGLDGADGGLRSSQGLRLGVDDRLQLEVARVRLAHDILADALLEQAHLRGLDALERNGRGRQAVPQAGNVARHGSAMPMGDGGTAGGGAVGRL